MRDLARPSHCRVIVILSGENSFVDNWPQWREIARVAVDVLTPQRPVDESVAGASAFPRY